MVIIIGEMGMLVVMETEKKIIEAQVMAVRIKQIMQIMKGKYMRDASQRQLRILSGKSYSNLNANSYANRKRDGSYSCPPKGVLIACLYWMLNRPLPPERSIGHQFQEMAQIIAEEVKSEKGWIGWNVLEPCHCHGNSAFAYTSK